MVDLTLNFLNRDRTTEVDVDATGAPEELPGRLGNVSTVIGWR